MSVRYSNVLNRANFIICLKYQQRMASSTNIRTNRLAQEKSPYLLQHARNPVDWYPWGEEALEKARRENKLIFLSVGYSTCHWCHVMERESFENEDIGAFLNDNYVCIKVDREERPDVDRVYMNFIQATTGGGGWPMNVWLTPDLKPVVGGTYFPPDDRYFGKPGFKTVLQHILTKWQENADGVQKQGSSILEALQKASKAEAQALTVPGSDVIDLCVSQLKRTYEPDMGGFGRAPKFPQPVNLNFLLRAYSNDPISEKSRNILKMVTHTMDKMAQGGMNDHIAKGFHRYSTDNDWHVPHFEKMLYDQAQLAVSYAELYQATKDDKYAEVLRDILEYVGRDLSHHEGGFYSAEDADSLPSHNATEKKEGAFCVWTKEEITSLLSLPITGNDNVTSADVFGYHYDVKDNGNVDPMQDPHDELKHQNVLIVRGSLEQTAAKFSMTTDDVTSVLTGAREILSEARQKRPPPHLDNKMLTAWNGLMLSGYAKAGQALCEKKFIDRAKQAAQFIHKYQYTEDSATLLRSSYVTDVGDVIQVAKPIEGFVDDYCFLIGGLLDLYEGCYEPWLLRWADRLQETQNALFWDTEAGGYYSNSGRDPSIVIRLKEDQDGAEPCPNSVAVTNLLRLSSILNKAEYKEKAVQTFKTFGERLEKIPMALPQMACGLIMFEATPKQIIIVGDLDSSDTQELLQCVHSHFLPNKVLIHHNPGNNTQTDDVTKGKSDYDWLKQHLVVLETLEMKENKATAYVCENYVCSLPVNNVQNLQALLRNK